MKTKTCWACKLDKPLDEFHRDAAQKDGLQTACKPCNREAVKQWSVKHPEYYTQWYCANFEARNERRRQLYAKNAAEQRARRILEMLVRYVINVNN